MGGLAGPPTPSRTLGVPRSSRGSSLASVGLVVALFAGLGAIRFSAALTGWFIFDDARAMVYATRPLSEIFLSRAYSPSYYTPLVALSLWPDVVLHGLNPVMYHVHNAILVVAISSVMYLMVRRHVPDSPTAVAAGLVVLLSSPALVGVLWITLRQYLYATLFALLAVHLHLRRVSRPRQHLIETAAIAIACELSFLGKEQFMTLPAVLFALTGGSLRRRLRLTYPYLAVLALHVLLRAHVLGGAGGGPWLVEHRLAGYLADAATALPRTAAILFGTPLALVLALGPWLRRWRALVRGLVVWNVALALAILAMRSSPSTDDHRYWLQATVLFAFAIALGAASIGSALLRTGYLALVLVWIAVQGAMAGRPLDEHFRREAAVADQVSRALRRPDLAGALIVAPASHYAHSDYLASMARLHRRDDPGRPSPAVFPRELLVLEPQLLNQRHGVYAVSPEGLRDIFEAAFREAGALRESRVTPVKPGIELGGRPTLDIHVDCRAPSTEVAVFSFRGPQLQFADRGVLPYRATYSTGLRLDRNAEAGIVPIDAVLFAAAGRPGDEGEGWADSSAHAIACQYPDGRSSLLSDAVRVRWR